MLKYTYIGSKVPLEVRDSLYALIKRLGFTTVGNFRYTPMDDPDGLDEFEEITDQGVGSSFEREVDDSAGRKWLVGCDYGD